MCSKLDISRNHDVATRCTATTATTTAVYVALSLSSTHLLVYDTRENMPDTCAGWTVCVGRTVCLGRADDACRRRVQRLREDNDQLANVVADTAVMHVKFALPSGDAGILTRDRTPHQILLSLA